MGKELQRVTEQGATAALSVMAVKMSNILNMRDVAWWYSELHIYNPGLSQEGQDLSEAWKY